MRWEELIELYDALALVGGVAPIAHTQLTAHIGILLDKTGHFLAAKEINESIYVPCTIESECRTSNIAPHLLHDNLSYVAKIDKFGRRHAQYMEQLRDYLRHVDDPACVAVYRYLSKGTIMDDLEPLSNDDRPLDKYAIAFAVKGVSEDTISEQWTEYYLSTLPQNGICAITNKPDHIPHKYPANVRYQGDWGKLFVAKQNRNGVMALDSMPQLLPGYIASQKILHVLAASNRSRK